MKHLADLEQTNCLLLRLIDSARVEFFRWLVRLFMSIGADINSDTSSKEVAIDD